MTCVITTGPNANDAMSKRDETLGYKRIHFRQNKELKTLWGLLKKKCEELSDKNCRALDFTLTTALTSFYSFYLLRIFNRANSYQNDISNECY